MGLFDFLKGQSKTSIITEKGTVTDEDGNVYQTIRIGNQVWTTENLRTTKFNDGTPIPHIAVEVFFPKRLTTSWEAAYTAAVKECCAAWKALTTPGYCYYAEKPNDQKLFGALYNWYAVDTKKLAPAGWHVPYDAEWDALQDYLIANGYNYDRKTTGNKIAKSMAAQTKWNLSYEKGAIGHNTTRNNRSGFSALPGGWRDYNGEYRFMHDAGFWWSASKYALSEDATSRALKREKASLEGSNVGASRNFGYSVRLVRDN
jgi:uncharacterized protein (TIGR02145 family)